MYLFAAVVHVSVMCNVYESFLTDMSYFVCVADKVIRIWRVYAFAHETLSPLASFYCMQTPILMTVAKHRLTIALQDHSTATYSIVLYRLNTKGIVQSITSIYLFVCTVMLSCITCFTMVLLSMSA